MIITAGHNRNVVAFEKIREGLLALEMGHDDADLTTLRDSFREYAKQCEHQDDDPHTIAVFEAVAAYCEGVRLEWAQFKKERLEGKGQSGGK